jgi:hypothetical protein
MQPSGSPIRNIHGFRPLFQVEFPSVRAAEARVEHQLGRINIVAWQDRRVRDAQRAGAFSTFLGATAFVSALLLLLRFAFGAPLSLEVLQLAFAVFAVSGALLLMRGLVILILRLQRP